MSLYAPLSNQLAFSSHVIICFVQVSGANPKSSFFYTRSKGLTEQALAELGYKDTVVFRPAMLSGTNRPESRFVETAFQYAPLILSCCPFCPSCFRYCHQYMGNSSLTAPSLSRV
jgi:hypothetical protein